MNSNIMALQTVSDISSNVPATSSTSVTCVKDVDLEAAAAAAVEPSTAIKRKSPVSAAPVNTSKKRKLAPRKWLLAEWTAVYFDHVLECGVLDNALDKVSAVLEMAYSPGKVGKIESTLMTETWFTLRRALEDLTEDLFIMPEGQIEACGLNPLTTKGYRPIYYPGADALLGILTAHGYSRTSVYIVPSMTLLMLLKDAEKLSREELLASSQLLGMETSGEPWLWEVGILLVNNYCVRG